MLRPKNTTFIVKTVSSCNLGCNYCYAESDQRSSVVSDLVVKRLVEGLARVAPDRVQIIWHGGEPLLAGMPFFRRALDIERRYARPEQKIVNNVQTNGTLLSDRWIDFMQEFGIGIGISIDGYASLHDSQRPFRSGDSSFARVMAAITALQARDISFGVCTVVTEKSATDPVGLYEFFRANRVHEIDFLPCLPSGKNPASQALAVQPSSFSRFLIQIFDTWLADDAAQMYIRYLANVLQGMLRNYSTLCKLSNTCSSFVSIGTDGSVYPCDAFMEYDELKFGNLNEAPLEEILSSSRYTAFVTAVEAAKAECMPCAWKGVCNGGCSVHRYIGSRDLHGRNIFCEGTQALLWHIKARLEELGEWPPYGNLPTTTSGSLVSSTGFVSNGAAGERR